MPTRTSKMTRAVPYDPKPRRWLEKMRERIASGTETVVNLGGVNSLDLAQLAVLEGVAVEVRRSGGRLRLNDVTLELTAILELVRLDHLLRNDEPEVGTTW